MKAPGQDIYDWVSKLKRANIHFAVATFRDDALMLQISVPGERWEAEFFPDGTVEVERFRSDGRIAGADALDELLHKHAD
jgi:hypothetical protein